MRTVPVPMGGAINKAGRIARPAFSAKVIWGVVTDAYAGTRSGRRCLATLSVQTTERYVGGKQRLRNAVDDRIGPVSK